MLSLVIRMVIKNFNNHVIFQNSCDNIIGSRIVTVLNDGLCNQELEKIILTSKLLTVII